MTRILIVDDDASTSAGLRALLELDGYEVVAPASSPRALELLDTEAFDAVITDLEMPVVNGISIVRAARAVRSNMPVLVITGYARSPAAAAALALGAQAVLDKPLDFDDLDRELHAALSVR